MRHETRLALRARSAPVARSPGDDPAAAKMIEGDFRQIEGPTRRKRVP
jgi:hypothetical protein